MEASQMALVKGTIGFSSIKTKLGMTLAATALGITLAGAGTYALFTSTTVNSGNTFTSGQVLINDSTTGTLSSQALDFGNLAPGDHGTVSMTVKNNGTLDAWVRINTVDSDASKTGGLFAGATPLQLIYAPDVINLAPGASHDFVVTYDFPLTADQTYQGAAGTFNVKVDAVQARNNTNADQTGPVAWN
jgi:spore coat-associated protein N